jgi:mRNA interferase RelE/StbE
MNAYVKKLVGMEDLYQLRVGNYRVVYTIQDNKLIVTIIRLGNRSEIYKRF